MFRKVIDSRVTLWVLLLLPSLSLMASLMAGGTGPEGQPLVNGLLHPTGEFAVRFMIIAMIMTPMRLLFPKSRFWIWMIRRRRYFGVAAFGYAALHTAFYLIGKGSFSAVLNEALELGIWTGWLGFAIFVPLAVTSNDGSVRRLGRRWKSLQRWVYPAALLIAAHWIFVGEDFAPALVHFLPLAGLEAYRLWHLRRHQGQRNRPLLPPGTAT